MIGDLFNVHATHSQLIIDLNLTQRNKRAYQIARILMYLNLQLDYDRRVGIIPWRIAIYKSYWFIFKYKTINLFANTSTN